MNPETVNQTGESAFPQWKSLGNAAISEGGLTMRDYFAAKAMNGMLCNPEFPQEMDIASAAYEVADAMMKARES